MVGPCIEGLLSLKRVEGRAPGRVVRAAEPSGDELRELWQKAYQQLGWPRPDCARKDGFAHDLRGKWQELLGL